jgi:hypothetical protein
MAETAETATTAAATPRDDFPPHGYLDNLHQSWKLNPSGVLRSRPPAGMGWHVPNHGSYGKNQFQYRAHLHVGIEVAGARVLTPDDCARAKIQVRCDLHTKHRLRYVFDHPAGVRLAATYFPLDDHALGCQIALERIAAGPHANEPALPVRLWLAQELGHNPATSRLWEHGLYAVLPGAQEPATGAAGLQGVSPEGDAWAHGAAGANGTPLAPTTARREGAPWLGKHTPAGGEPPGLQTATLLLAYDLVPELSRPPGSGIVLYAALARGVSSDLALRAWRDAVAGAGSALAEREREDERFWAAAPRLSGDWPGHWRRGFVVDLETLRMMARPPAGVFTRHWDGMQIQAPRSVLAETALDALALGWADPALAREVLLECFAAAPRPNVPCMREDGSYNMIADDGAVCGTGPEWGWPLAVADTLYRRGGDRTWLAALYPHVAAYLDWWLTERRDAEGWVVHACSWESGQDVSTRFGAQSTGGSDTRHLRPVDLHAAAAQGCALLAAWAQSLARPAQEVARWQAEAQRLSAHTRSMWQSGWFRDFDARRSRWSDVRDPMQLAPLAAGLATPEQVAALRPAFGALPRHAGAYAPLVWPPVAYTALEAALAAGRDEHATELAAEILDRAWRRMDGRDLEPDGALPGVTREFWPEGGPRVSAGIEGYGWGALTVVLLVRYLAGLREESPRRFRLVAALPRAWRRPGAVYTLGPVPYGAGSIQLTYRATTDADDMALDVGLTLSDPAGVWTVHDEGEGRELARAAAEVGGAVHLAWRGTWLRPVVVARA